MLKTGSKLYCKEDFNKHFSLARRNSIVLTKYKPYVIEAAGYKMKIYIVNDINQINWFTESSYRDYFWTEQEYRKMKLKKLRNVDTKCCL